MERVLMEPQRDANPFFHLMEAVWMLAGRRDGTWLDAYVRDFSQRYGESDGTMHGAYGHRWRRHFDVEGGGAPGLPDQLLTVGRMLFDDPTTRRAVLTMWDPVADLNTGKTDIPCNLTVAFRARRRDEDGADGPWYLDTTVFCRSNDCIWGMTGANAVHMSVLAEVVAGLAGMRLGVYRQVSNNLHVYTDGPSASVKRVWPPERLNAPSPYIARVSAQPIIRPVVSSDVRDRSRVSEAMGLTVAECELFCESRDHGSFVGYITPWLRNVVVPMERAHRAWREGHRAVALTEIENVTASDWRTAAQEWMQRRMK
jgi:thymidylate synthase